MHRRSAFCHAGPVARFIVVGGGISGLTAARDLADAGHDVLLLEGTDRLGGKLRRGEVAGIAVDVGAEAMINRRPEGVALATAVGLPVTHPTGATSRIWTRGALRPLPRTLMGAPLDLDQLEESGILSAGGVRRGTCAAGPDVDGDVSVGDLVAQRYGDEVVDRLVEPLLGGVYAGQARSISARAAVPQLRRPAHPPSSSMPDGPASAAAPVFAGVPGGMWRLPDALEAACAATGRVEVRTGAPVAGCVVPRTASSSSPTTASSARTASCSRRRPHRRPGCSADLAPAAAAELSGDRLRLVGSS